MKEAKVTTTQPRSLREHGFSYSSFEYLHHDQLSITITQKGQQVKIVKPLKAFNFVDLSSNHFEGIIPEELMNFKGLLALNLSHNGLSGHIPSSLGNLRYLESLDLSSNSLTEEIPVQLAGLSFLAVLNLSYNNLVGEIPTGTQIQSFEATSFEGNKGLCGPPLHKDCSTGVQILSSPTFESHHSDPIEWNFLSIEMGFVFGLGLIVLPLIFLKPWRLRYCMFLNDVLYRIFPQLDFVYEHHGRQNYQNLRWTRR